MAVDSDTVFILYLFLIGTTILYEGRATFVDTGNPYKDGPLPTGEIIFSKSVDRSPLHTKVYFPLPSDEYPAVYYIGGFENGLIPSEFYGIFLTKVASHGFFVFGVDSMFPLYSKPDPSFSSRAPSIGDAIDKFYEQLTWLKTNMRNRTQSVLRWDRLSLMCHSAGCNSTLYMILRNTSMFHSTIFLEPLGSVAKAKIDFRMPALMFGTQLSEVGLPCSIKGFDWNTYYSKWTCPKIKMEVANFGHCDILDPEPWETCHLMHFCVTTNDTHLAEYRQFVQGVVSSFLISELQGRTQDLVYITDKTRMTLPLLQLEYDLNCTENYLYK